MPYTLSGETLNPTHSLTQSYINSFQWKQFDSGEMACLRCAFLNFFLKIFLFALFHSGFQLMESQKCVSVQNLITCYYTSQMTI